MKYLLLCIIFLISCGITGNDVCDIECPVCEKHVQVEKVYCGEMEGFLSPGGAIEGLFEVCANIFERKEDVRYLIDNPTVIKIEEPELYGTLDWEETTNCWPKDECGFWLKEEDGD